MQRAGAALLILLLVTGPAAAQDAKSAEAFLRKIYSHYKAKGQPIELTGPQAETILDPTLAALLRQDEQAVNGEVGVLDGDPICDCQDFDIRSVRVAVQPDGAGRAKATASFKNLGSATKVSFDLATFMGQWRITNIYGANLPDLRKALEEEIASVKQEQAKPPH